MSEVKPNGRAALLETAARVFATEGPQALTVRRLAREVGASTMAIYSSFSGKEELIAATADEFVTRFAAALRAVPATDDALADFVQMGRVYRAVAHTNPHLYRVAFQSGRLSLLEDTPSGIAGIYAYVVDVLARCVEQGVFPGGDPVRLLMVMWTAVHGQVRMELERIFPSRETADVAWEIFFRAVIVGLGADPAHVERAFRKR